MPTISVHEYNSLVRDSQLLKQFREDQMVAKFVSGLAENVLLGMVQLPMSQWPAFGKAAWDKAYERAPTAAEIYKRRLKE